jgi:hypothetical protein
MSSTRTRRRFLTAAALAAVVAAGAAGAWAWSDRGTPDPVAAGAVESTTAAAPTLVTEPADPADVATDAPVPSTPSPAGATGATGATGAPAATADVVLSYSGWDDATSAVEVNAFVVGLVQDGGTCTLELTGSGDPVSVQAPAQADASTTTCGLLTTAGTVVDPGTWKAVVSYSSPMATGVSTATSVEVPR